MTVLKPSIRGGVLPLTHSARPLYGGRYELLDLVGAGGAGTVYRARDVELDEIVALKVLRKELVRAPEVVERFRSEVKLARRVTHRNVARMFDIGEHEGERFLTMEFVEGHMLSARLAVGPGGTGQPLPLPLLLQVVQQICAGLAAAHAVGVIHRDLKPDNIMFGSDGRVTITDFGIARALQTSALPPVATGEFVGTPEYMSPEQAEGGAIDLRTDIYSLGVMLFELLTGTVPFTGATPLITAAARLMKPAPDPRHRRPDLPAAVAHVVLRCLARQPQDRYASAEEVALALGAALATTREPSVSVPENSAVFTIIPRRPSEQPQTIQSSEPPHDGQATVSAGLRGILDGGAVLSMALAVLPFRNQGPAEDTYLADGLTDDLVDALSMVKGLRVRSRGAVRAQAAQNDPTLIGRALDVEVLVDGTVRRAGQLLRISARLVKVADGDQVWAQRFDRPAAEALQVSDEVAQAVAAALIGGAAGPSRAILQDGEAVDLYLRARALSQPGTSEGLRASMPLYEQALALRPSDPTVLTAYAQALARLWFFGGEGSGELARAAAEQAVAAAPERGESHLALATVRFHVGDPAGAVTALRQALKLTPSLTAAHDLLGRILVESGPYELGLRHIERALTLEPWLNRSQFDRARVQALLGQWDLAEQILEEQWNADAMMVPVAVTQARLAMWRRELPRAEALLQRPELLRPQLTIARNILEIILGRRRMDVRELFGPGIGSAISSPRGQSFFHQIETEMYSYYREYDQAIRSLARAVDVGFFDQLWLDGCPLLAPLRTDPRFQALRKIVLSRTAKVHEALL